MRTITLDHAAGHAVTIFVDHVVAVQSSRSTIDTLTLVQFGGGYNIPVIETRQTILKKIEEMEREQTPLLPMTGKLDPFAD